MKCMYMIRQNSSQLNKSFHIVLVFLLCATRAWSQDIQVNAQGALFEKTGNLSISELAIVNGYSYLNIDGEWIVYKDNKIKRRLKFDSMDVSAYGIIGTKSLKYSYLSTDGDLLLDELEWGYIDENGASIKKKDKKEITIISKKDTLILYGFDYAKPFLGEFCIAWNVDDGETTFFLVNKNSQVIVSTKDPIDVFFNKFIFYIDNEICIYSGGNMDRLEAKYLEYRSCGDYLALFNNERGVFEIKNKYLKTVYSLELDWEPITNSYKNYIVLFNRKTCELKEYDIEKKKISQIEDYKIGKGYLFIKTKIGWLKH